MVIKKVGSAMQEKATYVPWVLYIVALVVMFILMATGVPFLTSYLRSVVLFNAGIQGMWAGLGHILKPVEVAKKIGWPSSGFQTEIGGTNIAFGFTGILAFFIPTWVMPVALMVAIFYAGCVYAHIKDWKNKAPCNTGPMLYNTIWVSATLFIAIIFS